MWKWWKKKTEETDRAKEAKELNFETNPDLHKIKINSFREADYVAKILQKKRAVFIDLNELRKEERRRVLDFLSGTIYFTNGKAKKIKENIYYFQLPNQAEPEEE